MSRASTTPRQRITPKTSEVVLALAVSPYHLSTREVPAMLGLTLGTSVTTLLPEPPEGASRASVKEAVGQSPRFLRLMDSWRWSSALWKSGVISASVDGARASDELAGVYQEIMSDPARQMLRPLTDATRALRSQEPMNAFDALCADVIRGGPDPGVSIPLTAALDRFSVAHDFWAVRGATNSIAQRAELLMSRRVYSFAMPLLIRAGGGRVLELRRDLTRELNALRIALNAAFAELDESGPGATGRNDDLAFAASTYRSGFEIWSKDGATGDDENGERVVAGYVNVTGVILPADAALRCGIAAAGAISPGRAEAATHPAPGRLIALIVREMNARPA